MPGFDSEAAASFFGSSTPPSAPSTFDLSTLQHALPSPHSHPTSQTVTALRLQQQHHQQQQSQHSQQSLQQQQQSHLQQLQSQQHQPQLHNNSSTLASWATDFVQVVPQAKLGSETTLPYRHDVPIAVHPHPYQQSVSPFYSWSCHDDNGSPHRRSDQALSTSGPPPLAARTDLVRHLFLRQILHRSLRRRSSMSIVRVFGS